MSVLNRGKVHYFKAPLSISPTKVTVSGSWSTAPSPLPMDPTQLFRLRVHVWKQQYRCNVADVCMDWVITNESGVARHALVLQTTDLSIADCLQDEVFGSHIQNFINQNTAIIPIHTAFNNCTQGHV